MGDPKEESVRIAMDQAWRDHQHARDQTWKALQIEAVLGAGLVTIEAQFSSTSATIAAGILVVFSAVFGLLISWHHRKLERRKIIHIFFCEDFLGLHRDDLIPKYRPELEEREEGDLIKDSAVKPPERFSFWRIFDPTFNNTAVFIMRMHVAIMLFAVVFILARIGITS